MQEISEMLQWHPAFFAGLQIEFQEEAGRFVFENEHHLGTKPKQIIVTTRATPRLNRCFDAIVNSANIFNSEPLEYFETSKIPVI